MLLIVQFKISTKNGLLIQTMHSLKGAPCMLLQVEKHPAGGVMAAV